MTLLNTLAPWQWVLFAAVPVAIVALYFLKLRRQPLIVPSTYLWRRTVEDLHVNALWQRLRRSLLLALQLLLIALAMAACLRPGWRGQELPGDRFIFLVDTSASMSATDVQPTRLDAAKQRLLALVDQMQSGDAALLVSFSDEARVEQSFTDNRSLLRQKINRMRPTQHRSDLQEALRVAAGLANPGRISEDVGDIQVAGALPATLYLFTDGGFESVPDFALGNLTPIYVPLGTPQPDNVGIMAFSVERNPEKQGRIEAFARLENTGTADVTGELTLSIDGELADASQLRIAAQGEAGVQFELGSLQQGVLQISWQRPDHLALDNVAYAVAGVPRRARVLLVTAGNEALVSAATTAEAQATAEVTVQGTEYLATQEYRDAAAAAAWDFVIYDRCVPPAMPEANTWFVGQVPPLTGWSRGPTEPLPFIIDTDRAHPLTQLVDMGSVRHIYDGFVIKGPAGAASLFESASGPLLVIASRGGFEDAALGFEIVGKSADGKLIPKTDWPARSSFPLFVMNVLGYLGGLQGSVAVVGGQPGIPAALQSRAPAEHLDIRLPSGKVSRVFRKNQNAFVFADTDELGVYEVSEGSAAEVTQRFAVNLLDRRESNLAPRAAIELGFETVTGQVAAAVSRRELWKPLLLLALGVLLFEWYVFNRRIFG